MISRISYMGTKHALAPTVHDVLNACQPGLLLDVFAGMGAVAESLANKRPVWTNDVQHFAHLATSCRIADPAGPLGARRMAKLIKPHFLRNLTSLREQNDRALRLERKALRKESFEEFRDSFDGAQSECVHHQNAYGCFSKTYSFGYFSLEQCTEIDSIRYGLELLRGCGTLSGREFQWGIFALGGACLRLANTTGHFAQYLTPSPNNFRRVIKQFSRSVWKEWLSSIISLKPVGRPDWREKNFATRSEGAALLSSNDMVANVVYCDPPYTTDQYSRYYHVWETLVLYDYPETTGKGRYRPNRFVTDFCLSTKVADAFDHLVASAAKTGADLILSYPSNGLLHEIDVHPLEILRSHYPTADIAAEIPYEHSTMGGSKGPSKFSVKERIYLAKI